MTDPFASAADLKFLHHLRKRALVPQCVTVLRQDRSKHKPIGRLRS